MSSAVSFEGVSVQYADAAAPALRDVSFEIDEASLALVIGRTGSGKSTLLGAINGSVPHFTGGTLGGRVLVHGRDTRTLRPRDLADLVGVVGQDPLAGFVTDTVEEELAYGMEQLGLAPSVMRKRVEETLDVLGIADLRGASLRQLSGGQQQRVAIGSVLTTHPQVIVLDEPTSALDPTAAEEVLATIARLVQDLAVTVVLAEHRIERVLAYADHIIHVRTDRTAVDGDPAEIMLDAQVAPPIVELGRWAGWRPLPLAVRDARRRATALRAQLTPPPVRECVAGEVAVRTERLSVAHGPLVAVREATLALHAGEIVTLMGRNGAGKSSLMWAIQGSGPHAGGKVSVLVDGAWRDPRELDAGDRRTTIGLVPQTASDLLYRESVGAECGQADRESKAIPGTCRGLLDSLAPGIHDGTHPRDLSEGQKLALVLAIQLTARPRVMILDEPTRGLDYSAKAQLTAILRGLRDAGRSVLLSTHDVEFAAGVSDRVVVMADGDVVADGSPREIMTASPAYAPQVAKILAPAPWLTVDEVVMAAAARVGGRDE
ncbi:ABC transporter ATP-binding protein [Blastococcus sp. Marseille-P5729]|uniref:ABC transporter ATP-binding protein n=1 Tax=Blastococcus sp. Marseille-P5729 TaxID=2086582 RepID=UPI000D0F37FA|nr:ABC transporter ATP-binding protein [Blastococcus sp. Marseille-P5729]